MWFLFAVLTALSWGLADLFYKKGSDPKDKYSHLKIVVMVGLVMGIHATFYLFTTDVSFKLIDMVFYFPVSALYIISMTIGYIGLRYIELSIASPIQNSSGVITTILLFLFFTYSLSGLQIFSIVLVSTGVILLAILERNTEMLQLKTNSIVVDKKYQYGFLAIMFPILYAIFDGLGTFADAIYLDELQLISEGRALLAYEYTFFVCGAAAFVFLKWKKESINVLKEKTRGTAAILETIGQFFYVFAMSSNAIISAPLVASYSVFSVIFSRIFLKEKLTKQQYAVVIMVLIGIALLGLSEEL